MVFMTLCRSWRPTLHQPNRTLPHHLQQWQQLHCHFYMVDANNIKLYLVKPFHWTKLLKAYTDVYQYLWIHRYSPNFTNWITKLQKTLRSPLWKSTLNYNTLHFWPHQSRTPLQLYDLHPRNCICHNGRQQFLSQQPHGMSEIHVASDETHPWQNHW